jgi:hypothetical protein
MVIKDPAMCLECGWNLPFHSHTCGAAPVYKWYCDDHAPSGQTPVTSLSDSKKSCLKCKRPGQRVRGYSY